MFVELFSILVEILSISKIIKVWSDTVELLIILSYILMLLGVKLFETISSWRLSSKYMFTLLSIINLFRCLFVLRLKSPIVALLLFMFHLLLFGLKRRTSKFILFNLKFSSVSSNCKSKCSLYIMPFHPVIFFINLYPGKLGLKLDLYSIMTIKSIFSSLIYFPI